VLPLVSGRGDSHPPATRLTVASNSQVGLTGRNIAGIAVYRVAREVLRAEVCRSLKALDNKEADPQKRSPVTRTPVMTVKGPPRIRTSAPMNQENTRNAGPTNEAKPSKKSNHPRMRLSTAQVCHVRG
jgi:hypothetical protein